MDIAEPPPKPRTPAAVIAAVALLWLLTIAAAWTAAIATVATSFEVTARYDDSLSPLEFIEPLLITAVAAITGLLAAKVWSGRDWCGAPSSSSPRSHSPPRSSPKSASRPASASRAPSCSRQCSSSCSCAPPATGATATRPHSPRIEKAAQPPYLVVAALLVLWTAVGVSLYIGSSALLGLAAEDAVSTDGVAWLAGATLALAIVHAALNIAFSYHRNWARWVTIALAAAYTLGLVVAAVVDLFSEGTGPWLVPALLCRFRWRWPGRC